MPSHNKEIFVRKTLYVPFNVTCENQSQHLSHTYSPSTLLLPHPDATPLQGDFVWNCLYVPVDVAHGTCTWHMRIDRNASLTHFFFYQLLPQMRIYQNMQADRDFLSSGENESCRMWMSHVVYEWVIKYVNMWIWDMSKWVRHVTEATVTFSLQVRMSNFSCERVTSHMKYSFHVWMSRASWWKYVMSHMNDSYHIWMSRVTYEWVCHIWIRHVTNKWVMSHLWISYVTHSDESC